VVESCRDTTRLPLGMEWFHAIYTRRKLYGAGMIFSQ
jgi:hypothetical protein